MRNHHHLVYVPPKELPKEIGGIKMANQVTGPQADNHKEPKELLVETDIREISDA